MPKKRILTEAEKKLFRSAVNKIPKVNAPLSKDDNHAPSEIPGLIFSDHESVLIEAESFLSYHRAGISARDFKKLKSGLMPIKASLDLHGETIESAREKLIQFFKRSLKNKYKIIHIIHGKGMRSGQPVLKSKVNAWLKQIEQVLAFCSCTAKDGGTGAVYIWIKR